MIFSTLFGNYPRSKQNSSLRLPEAGDVKMWQGGKKIAFLVEGVVGKICVLRKVDGKQGADCQQLTVRGHQPFGEDFSPDFVYGKEAADTLSSEPVKVVQKLLRVSVAETIFGQR